MITKDISNKIYCPLNETISQKGLLHLGSMWKAHHDRDKNNRFNQKAKGIIDLSNKMKDRLFRKVQNNKLSKEQAAERLNKFNLRLSKKYGLETNPGGLGINKPLTNFNNPNQVFLNHMKRRNLTRNDYDSFSRRNTDLIIGGKSRVLRNTGRENIIIDNDDHSNTVRNTMRLAGIIDRSVPNSDLNDKLKRKAIYMDRFGDAVASKAISGDHYDPNLLNSIVDSLHQRAGERSMKALDRLSHYYDKKGYYQEK